jgi:ribulose-bisphosphate carboxylase large chain
MSLRRGTQPGDPYSWQGVATTAYKTPDASHCGVSRTVLAGETGERTAFHVRYFEIAPGGHTTLEHHSHEHVVVILRGRGEVFLGGQRHALGSGDAVYVAPDEVHQLRNTSADEPFGFLCMVDAQRDRPVVVGPGAETAVTNLP